MIDEGTAAGRNIIIAEAGLWEVKLPAPITVSHSL